MSIYEDIMRAQVKQGNMGGRNGPLGYLLRDNKKKEKASKPKVQKPAKAVVTKNPFTIKLEEGTITNPTDSNGLSDPYLIIMAIKPDNSLSKVLFKSTVCKKTLTPVWNESGEFFVNDNVSTLMVELWDHDVLSKNDFIGRTIISMYSLVAGYTDNLKFYNGSENVEGTAKLTITKKEQGRF
ncbi:hypothetical protein RB653_010313 [Dictyostelium firmibasis]|uniref:C2 domain-containing protein n=1 Tax=Dictyostelium firmibasis TaxID=79012 RepID=A0AAN7U101_9MYCE